MKTGEETKKGVVFFRILFVETTFNLLLKSWCTQKGNKLVSIQLHSSKLKPSYRLWSPFELEALVIAVAIETKCLLLRESTNPVLPLPDSKPVQDAIQLIQQGKFSALVRMNHFLTNINKISITFTLVQQVRT